MYIDNTKKLFEDLISIDTISSYMAATEDDGRQENLTNLVDIVYNEKDQPLDGTSLRWDIELGDKQQIRKDKRILQRIWSILQKELHCDYVVRCNNCGYEYLYLKNLKYPIENYKCSKCNEIGYLELIQFEDWATPEIMDLRGKYVH